ncbi:MAG: helix-turn-helix transcriptional regulator [Nitrospiraceae bacterium]|nr:MAG: helix-turn-helix transcriptional regulator [Nitrospiraceae bacterium]
MPNIADVLKQEITRLSRKEIRGLTAGMKKASSQYRKDVADLKRQVAKLKTQVSLLGGKVLQELPSPQANADAQTVRFIPKGLRSQRKRLSLSGVDCARLLGVTPQSVYKWERGLSRPRKEQLAGVAALRTMSKREVRARLEQLGGNNSGRTKKA